MRKKKDGSVLGTKGVDILRESPIVTKMSPSLNFSLTNVQTEINNITIY